MDEKTIFAYWFITFLYHVPAFLFLRSFLDGPSPFFAYRLPTLWILVDILVFLYISQNSPLRSSVYTNRDSCLLLSSWVTYVYYIMVNGESRNFTESTNYGKRLTDPFKPVAFQQPTSGMV